MSYYCDHCEMWKIDCGCDYREKIKELEQKLAEKQKSLAKELEAYSELELKYNRLELKTDEAMEVIRFYGDADNWTQEDSDYGRDRNIFTEELDEEFVDGKGHKCGKRARDFIEKHEVKQETYEPMGAMLKPLDTRASFALFYADEKAKNSR